MRFLTILRRPSWAEYLNRLLGPTLLALCVASVVRDPNLRMLLKQFVVACFISAFAAKEIADFPALWSRAVSEYRSKRRPLHFLASLIAPEHAGWFLTVARLLLGFLIWATGRRHPGDEQEGVRITYLKRSGYGVLVPLALLALFVDVPVSMLLLPALGIPEPLQIFIRSAIFLAGVLTLACLLGDRWHISSGTHSLNSGTLLLRIGVRFQAAIPLHVIQDAVPLAKTEKIVAQWSSRDIVASPFDRPNIKLALTKESGVRVTSWGCDFIEPRCIYVYVDEPAILLAQLRGEA
jgi:hypothetical protein